MATGLYAIYFPASTTITLGGDQSCVEFGAFHDYTPVSAGSAAPHAVFAVLPDCGDGLDGVASSHEIIEAATDPYPFTIPTPPDPFTWYVYNDAWFGIGGGEIADLCEGRGTTTLGGFTISTAWLNSSASAGHYPCQPSDPTVAYYAVAVPTEVVTGQHDTVGDGPDYSSDGYLVAAQGTTKTADAVMFSDRLLDHDPQLVIGKSSETSPDPTQVGTIAPGVTASLSQTTAHNGQHVTVTINIPSTTPTGDYPFVVRAIESQSDYHSWWVILRVTAS